MRFSILMPSMRRTYLAEAVNSVIAQTFEDWELIITDSSGNEPMEFTDTRIRWTRSVAIGSANFNAALTDAHGEILTFCADDDLMELDALAIVDAHIGDSRWLCGQMRTFPGDHIIGPSQYDFESEKASNSIAGGAVFWRCELTDLIGGMDESLRYCADWDFWLRMGAQSTPVIISNVLSRYRQHPQQDSHVNSDGVHRDVLTVMLRAREGFYG